MAHNKNIGQNLENAVQFEKIQEMTEYGFKHFMLIVFHDCFLILRFYKLQHRIFKVTSKNCSF